LHVRIALRPFWLIFGAADFGWFAIFGVGCFTGFFGSHFWHFPCFVGRLKVNDFLTPFLHPKLDHFSIFFSERWNSLVRGCVTL
jgi:hypothetical protein